MHESDDQPLGIFEAVSVVLMTLMFTGLLAQVVLRFVGVSFVWLNQSCTILFVWLVFAGVALAVKRTEHPVIEASHYAIYRRFGPAGQTRLDWLLRITGAVFPAVFAYGAARMAASSWHHLEPIIPGYRVGFTYLGVTICVVGAVILIFRSPMRLTDPEDSDPGAPPGSLGV